MIVGLLGTDFCSFNRGCGALGYATIEVLKSTVVNQNDTLEVYAFLFRVPPLPQICDENVQMHYIKIQPKKFSFWKNTRKIFDECDYILDFTGGDSFSDIYGMKRFAITSALKEVAIFSRSKFFMAPQTIGPFERKMALRWANHILVKAEGCFVRDSLSQNFVKQTFGIDAMLTTDVAFALSCDKNMEKDKKKIRVGFNPSGLLWDGTKEFSANKHITVDYKKYVKAVLRMLCSDEKYEIYLIPHVFSMNLDSHENDLKACIEIQELFPTVQVVCDFDTPMEAKGVISSMDIFVGARMHATIAAFSTGVATIPFSYSRKFEGLYHDLEYPYLISATHMETEAAIQATLEWVENYKLLEQRVESAQEVIRMKQKVFTDTLSHISSI